MPGDRLRLEVTLGRGAAAAIARARRVALRRRAGRGGGGAAARIELRAPGRATGRRFTHGHRAPGRRDRRGHVDRARTRRSARMSRIGQHCRIGASAVIDGMTEIGDGTQIFPFASIGLVPQDLKYQRRADAADDRHSTTSSASSSRSTAAPAGGGGSPSIGDHNLFMAYAHVAHDCPSATTRSSATRATLGGHVTVEDFATISAVLRRPPVLPRRRARVHRRLLGRHQGRAAVREDGRQPRAHLRRQHDRPRAPRVHRETRIEQAEARVPVSAGVAAQHQPRAPRRSSTTRRSTCRRSRYLVDFIRTSQRGVILRRPIRAPRKWSRRGTGCDLTT